MNLIKKQMKRLCQDCDEPIDKGKSYSIYKGSNDGKSLEDCLVGYSCASCAMMRISTNLLSQFEDGTTPLYYRYGSLLMTISKIKFGLILVIVLCMGILTGLQL